MNHYLLKLMCITVGCLCNRCHDVDAHVRRDAIAAVINILKSPAVDVSSMSVLADCVKERLRDIQVILTITLSAFVLLLQLSIFVSSHIFKHGVRGLLTLPSSNIVRTALQFQHYYCLVSKF